MTSDHDVLRRKIQAARRACLTFEERHERAERDVTNARNRLFALIEEAKVEGLTDYEGLG